MNKEEIIQGLQFTLAMFLLDPNTGETFTEPRNDMDKTTIDACRGAIELLEQEPVLDKIKAEIEALPKTYPFVNHIDMYIKENDVKKIIDKYKAESEKEKCR